MSRFDTNWAETELSCTLSLDEPGSVKIKNTPRVIVGAPWVTQIKEYQRRTSKAINLRYPDHIEATYLNSGG